MTRESCDYFFEDSAKRPTDIVDEGNRINDKRCNELVCLRSDGLWRDFTKEHQDRSGDEGAHQGVNDPIRKAQESGPGPPSNGARDECGYRDVEDFASQENRNEETAWIREELFDFSVAATGALFH